MSYLTVWERAFAVKSVIGFALILAVSVFTRVLDNYTLHSGVAETGFNEGGFEVSDFVSQ